MACCLVVVSLQVAWVGQVASRFQVIRDGQVGSRFQVVRAEARCREFARGFLRLRPGFRSLEPRDDGCWRKHPSYRKFLMTPWQQRTSKLTQRMAEDMLLRNMSQRRRAGSHRPTPVQASGRNRTYKDWNELSACIAQAGGTYSAAMPARHGTEGSRADDICMSLEVKQYVPVLR